LRTAKTVERERRKRWSFYTGDDGLWSWRVTPPEGRETVSKESFPTLTECILDAKQNGYVLWTSRDRRQAS
jgi:hypothetical protein